MSTKILEFVVLGPAHTPTGRTRHTFNGVEIGPPSSLHIVQYDGDPGYYLLYLDAEAREIADTYHDSLEEAMAQSEWEFNVKPDEWRPWEN